MAATLKNRDYYICYFITSTVDPNLHKCKECLKMISQNLKKGYANLVSHVSNVHKDDYIEKLRVFVAENVNGAMDDFVRKISTEAKDIYGWMDWIIMENLALRSCEKERFRKRSNLGIISRKRLKRFMKLTTKMIFEKIKKRAPKSYGLIIAAWSIGSDHYYAIFIT